jgi:hypothetical protein
LSIRTSDFPLYDVNDGYELPVARVLVVNQARPGVVVESAPYLFPADPSSHTDSLVRLAIRCQQQARASSVLCGMRSLDFGLKRAFAQDDGTGDWFFVPAGFYAIIVTLAKNRARKTIMGLADRDYMRPGGAARRPPASVRASWYSRILFFFWRMARVFRFRR